MVTSTTSSSVQPASFVPSGDQRRLRICTGWKLALSAPVATSQTQSFRSPHEWVASSVPSGDQSIVNRW